VTQNVHLIHSMHEVWQIRGRHFSTARGNFSRQIAPRMSARSARDSIMRPPRHQSRENAKRAASAACQRCRLWNLEDLLGSRWKTLSAAKRPIFALG